MLNRLKALQEDYAISSLRCHGGETEFAYGRHVGIVAGIEMAIDSLILMHTEEEEIGKEL